MLEMREEYQLLGFQARKSKSELKRARLCLAICMWNYEFLSLAHSSIYGRHTLTVCLFPSAVPYCRHSLSTYARL